MREMQKEKEKDILVEFVQGVAAPFIRQSERPREP